MNLLGATLSLSLPCPVLLCLCGGTWWTPPVVLPTALTALTSLQLYHLGAAVNDAAGLAVAASLRGLRRPALCGCDISMRSAATKAALRRLPMLTELVMTDEEVADNNTPTFYGHAAADHFGFPL